MQWFVVQFGDSLAVPENLLLYLPLLFFLPKIMESLKKPKQPHFAMQQSLMSNKMRQ
jgi:hypothetical protein